MEEVEFLFGEKKVKLEGRGKKKIGRSFPTKIVGLEKSNVVL